MTEGRRASEPINEQSGHTVSSQSSIDARKLVKMSKREAHTLSKHVETDTKSVRDESNNAEIREPHYVANYDHAGRDLKSAEDVKKELRCLGSDRGLDHLFALQKVALKSTSNGVAAAGTRSSAAGAYDAVKVTDEKSLVAEMRDHEKLDQENFLGVPPISRTEDTVKEAARLKFRTERRLKIEIPSAIEEELFESSNVIMNSHVMQDLNKLSKSVKSLQREESLTSSKYPDRLITRSASLRAPLPRSSLRASAAPRSLDSQMKARSAQEQPATDSLKTSWNSNERDFESKALTIWRFEKETGPNSSTVKHLPSPKAQARISNISSSIGPPTSREHATRKAAGRREGLSSSSSRSAREFLPLDRNSNRRKVLFGEECAPQPESGNADRINETSSVRFVSEEHLRAEEIDIDPEVRPSCSEKTRLSEDYEHNSINSPGPASRDISVSVLALARLRKSMLSMGDSLEMQQRHEQPKPQAQHEINIFPFTIRSLERDHREGEMEVENEDSSMISNSRPKRTDVESGRDQMQRNAQQIYAGVWQCGLQSPAPLPRRSRFFMEANSPSWSQVA